MKEAANALLKVLEEPPEFATLVLISCNPAELLPTIRSRCVLFQLAPLPASDIENMLAQRRPELNARHRALIARLSRGAIGSAEKFDLALYAELRSEALTLLGTARRDHSDLFRTTESYRSGAEAGERMRQLIGILYSLLEDLAFLSLGAPELIRNTDVKPQLEELARQVTFEWLARASHELAGLEYGMRRNLLRSLALDSFAAALDQ
jgi:DNA polymerase-3 subunit delta'